MSKMQSLTERLRSTIDLSVASLTSPIVFDSVSYSNTLDSALATLKEDITKTGTRFSAGRNWSRRGFLSDVFVADTLNLDAARKKLPDFANAPLDNGEGSPDVIINFGEQEASLKLYKTAKDSAVAHSDPNHKNKTLVFSSDQLSNGREYYESQIDKYKRLGNRSEVEKYEDLLKRSTSTIKTENGAESSEFDFEQLDNLAKAFSIDKNGNSVVNEAMLDEELKPEIKKNIHAEISNELRATGVSFALGFGIGFSITAAVELAKTGVSSADIKKIAKRAAVGGLESAIISTLSYSTARLFTELVDSTVADGVSSLFCFASGGLISIMISSLYSFAKYKQLGLNAANSFGIVAKNAIPSISTLASGVILERLLGISASPLIAAVSLARFSYSIVHIIHDRKINSELEKYKVELLEPVFN